MKPIYFLSDAHLGSWAVEHRRMQERRLVRFLDSIKHKAAAVYLLGDMFDFWYEYKYVVPRGYTRFLGKLSELSDLGGCEYAAGDAEDLYDDYIAFKLGEFDWLVLDKETWFGDMIAVNRGERLCELARDSSVDWDDDPDLPEQHFVYSASWNRR